MSFILDALKKSEEERRKGEAPRLHEGPPPAGSGKGSRWFLLLALALMFNGIILGWWLFSREEPVNPETSPVAETPAAPRKAPVVDLQAAEAEAVPKTPPESEERPASPTKNVAAALPRETEVQPVRARAEVAPAPSVAVDLSGREEGGTALAATEPDSEPEPAIPADPPEPVQAPEPSFPHFADLGSSLRAGLPALELQLHFFIDDPNRRLVRLNGINLREGEETPGGIRIVGIDPDGVRLICNGTRLFLPAGG